MKGLLATVLILGLALLGVALYQGWIVIGTGEKKSPDDNPGVNITLDKDKARQDLEAAKNKIKEVAGEAKEKVDRTFDGVTVAGEIMAVDASSRQLTIKTADKTDTVRVDDAAVIRLAGEAIDLGQIKMGDRVTAKIKDVGGRKVATEVAVTRK